MIGEHTDYNGGNVFPCAISLGTYAAFGNRDDKIIRGTLYGRRNNAGVGQTVLIDYNRCAITDYTGVSS